VDGSLMIGLLESLFGNSKFQFFAERSLNKTDEQ